MRKKLIFLSFLLLLVFLLAPFLFHSEKFFLEKSSDVQDFFFSTPEAAEKNTFAPLYRAVWISYLEWQSVDFSSSDAFLADISTMLDRLVSLGASVVIAQVRPFGDALYPSKFYPFSHLCTGVQGLDPGFDPLKILVQASHARGLEIEAWVNPYRIQADGVPSLCEKSPAVLHPDWIKAVGNSIYLDPASQEVRQFIADSLAELCDNYEIDGIHFDDYFYPTADISFDAEEYAAANTTLSLEDWRRQNVNALMLLCHEAVCIRNIRLGVSPQGNPCQNSATQYSDVSLWLEQGGYVDYVMPQLYWGLCYTKDGSRALSFSSLAEQWTSLPRAESVSLYAGLGAYRIGDGDGSDTAGEWQTGHALKDLLKSADAAGFSGAGLYRYDSLFFNTAWNSLASAESENIKNLWNP